MADSISEWKPKYPIVGDLARGAKHLSENVGQSWQGLGVPGAVGEAMDRTEVRPVDLTGLPALAKFLDHVAYGDTRLLENSARGREQRQELVEGAPLGMAAVGVAGKGFMKAAEKIAPAIAPRPGELRMFVGPTDREAIKDFQKYEKQGKFKEDLWQRYMIMRGEDTHLRTEISDEHARFNAEYANEKRVAPLIQERDDALNAARLNRLSRAMGWPSSSQMARDKFLNKYGVKPSDAAIKLSVQNPDELAKRVAKLEQEISGPQVYKLGDIFHHDELYQRYPELKDVPITINAGVPDEGGHFSPSTKSISLNMDHTPEQSADAKSVILHEIQHYIQDLHGWEPGANPDYIKKIKTAGFRGTMADAQAFAAAHQARLYVEKEGISGRDAIDKTINELFVGDGESAENLRPIIEQNFYGSRTTKELDSLADEQFKKSQVMLKAASSKGSSELYRRSMGEVEARNTQYRKYFSPQERRTTYPWETQDRPSGQQYSTDDLYNPTHEPSPGHTELKPIYKPWKMGDFE